MKAKLDQQSWADLCDIVREWVWNHPRYGIIEQALRTAHIAHVFIHIGYDGCIYPEGQKEGSNVRAVYADPNFFDDISALIDSHVSGCNVCQALLLPVSYNNAKN